MAAAAFDKPDIDEVFLVIDEKAIRVLPLEIWFDAPPSMSSGEWKLKAYDIAHDRDIDVPLSAITRIRPATSYRATVPKSAQGATPATTKEL